MAKSDVESADFSTILYNPASTEYLQRVWLAQGNTGNPLAKPVPDRPYHMSRKEWELASVRAPQGYQPTSAVGAAALQTRIVAQDEQAQQLQTELRVLQEARNILDDRKQTALDRGLLVKQNRLRKERKQRLWRIMQRLEMLRAYHRPLTHDEKLSMQHTVYMERQTDAVEQAVRSYHVPPPAGLPRLVMPDGQTPVTPEETLQNLETHHRALQEWMTKIQKDLRDLKLLSERLEEK